MTLPEVIMPYSQASMAMELLAAGEPLVRLAEGDLVVYLNRIDVRTRNASSQSAGNMLPSCEVIPSQLSTPTYLMRVRAEYDHHDAAALARRNISIVEAQRLAMHQAHNQQARIAELYGFNPANGEGLINTNGATAVTLPPDSFNNTTARTYDNGQMAFYLASQVLGIKQRSFQLGRGKKIVIIGPQRIMGLFEYNVVQLTEFQRSGAGVTSTAGTLKDVMGWSGDELIWGYDDTLIGQGAGGNDAIIMCMPEVENPQMAKWNTNIFAQLMPGLAANTMMLCDMAAPREITVPLAGGATDTLSEMRITSGWGVRPETITIISMPY